MSDVYGSLYMTANAAQEAKSKFGDKTEPMDVLKPHIEAALNHQGYNAHITVCTDFSFDTDDYDNTDKDLVDLRDDIWGPKWLDGHPDVSPHFNQLLMTADEWPNPGGAGGVSTIPRANSDSLPRRGVILDMVKIGNHSTSADRYGGRSDSIESKIRAGVHETGHNLDMLHRNGLRYEDTIQGQQVILATPMGCTSDDNWETSCGESCTTKDTQTWDHYYGSCEANNITL